ncbi:RES family NAD+ phosphorylase [Spectribacter acetivorans]|uniref:RES family NAD+ phosphorylase n=1 Tax=Spectribacter acetivorans TaxID=3075603 RepID=UPI003D771504
MAQPRERQRLTYTLAAYRIGDPNGAHPIFNPADSAYQSGRWDDRSTLVFYAGEYCSTAIVEKLAPDSTPA